MRMNRKDFLKTGAGAALAGSASAGQTQIRGARKPPNVLFLFSDQHRPDYLSCCHDSPVPTPEIDRIAARGVRFSRAVCPYPVCAASRMALLTGRYPHSTAVINNTDRLAWNARTVAHHFADSGYHTGLIGKMHFNDAHTHGFQFMMGFNDSFQYLGPKMQHFANEIGSHPNAPQFFESMNDDGSGLPELPDIWDGKSPWVGKVERLPWVGSQLAEEDCFDMFVARESCRFLRQYKDEPFFLVAGFLRPHPPMHPPMGYARKYPLDKMKLTGSVDLSNYPQHVQRRIQRREVLGDERNRAFQAGYLGNLEFLDHCVGVVYRQLEELGLLENTIVVYSSDHGDMMGQNGLYQKFCLYDGSVGVPFILSQPGTLPQNRVTAAQTEYLGLYPTLAELAGLPAPADVESTSFASIARNPDAKGPEAAFAEYNLRTR
ncbi:MAG: sulfatase-like hydrolase/transferase, partial [Bryobacterales bacterium]|nr:sulfatase-like hydrolase/transferase [Bryobacterales bacterium]